jgi:DNA-binding beta-propeller fold protein YncE
MKKFAENKKLFTLVYENRETRIYRVVGGDSDDVVTAPTREPLPEPTPGGEQLEPEEPPSILKTSDHADPPFFSLKEPRGAAVDGQSRIWIADFGHSRLRVFDSEGGSLGGWGGRGAGVYGFRELCGVAVAGNTLYVADTWNGRLEAFTLEGEPRATAAGLYGPRSVAVAPDGHVWAPDTGNHRVVRFDADLTNPLFVGKKGKAPGEFSNPVGIGVGPSGQVYVADTDNRRIQVLKGDGTLLRVLPFQGWDDTAEPHIVVDRDERLYVSDPAANAVVVLDSDGKVISRLVRDDAGQTLSRPTGLAIDPKTRILYVVNSGNNSVSFIRLSERKPA